MTVLPDANEQTLVSFDWAIKYLLRNKANFDVLEGLLCAILSEDVTVEEILESEGNQEYEAAKYNRVDILIRDSQGRYVIVEIQNERQTGFLQRLLFGASKAIVDQIHPGEPYTQVKKIISISIIYFPFGESEDYLYHGTTEFVGRHTKRRLELTDKEQKALEPSLGRKNIFPEYHLICLDRFENEVHDALDEWIYMLKNSSVKKSFHSKGIQKAREKLQLMNMSREEQQAYLRYLGRRSEEKDTFETARRDGHSEGRLEGHAEGIEEGKALGEKIGAENTAKQIASGLVGKISIEEIARITGLTQEEINEL